MSHCGLQYVLRSMVMFTHRRSFRYAPFSGLQDITFEALLRILAPPDLNRPELLRLLMGLAKRPHPQPAPVALPASLRGLQADRVTAPARAAVYKQFATATFYNFCFGGNNCTHFFRHRLFRRQMLLLLRTRIMVAADITSDFAAALPKSNIPSLYYRQIADRG